MWIYHFKINLGEHELYIFKIALYLSKRLYITA